MSVTDDQVATLRAQLTGDSKTHKELLNRLDPEAAQSGYTALVAAAFFEAAEQRFGADGRAADVIEFVSDVRSRSERLSDEVDPHVAERMLLAVFTDEEIDDLDSKTKFSVQVILLKTLIVEEQLDEDGLDEFLMRARKLADQMLR